MPWLTPQHADSEKILTTYPNEGLATGAKAAAEATVAIRQKAVFMVKSIPDCGKRKISGGYIPRKSTKKGCSNVTVSTVLRPRTCQ
jgi:hypothetical protein